MQIRQLARVCIRSKRMYVSLQELLGEEEVLTPSQERLKIKCPQIKGRFVSPWIQRKKSILSILSWQFNRKIKKIQALDEECKIYSIPVETQQILSKSSAHITWIGHSSALIQLDGLHFLTDPIWSKRASFSQYIGPDRYIDPPIEVESLPVDVVLLSHTHYDHFDATTIKRIGNRALWVVPLGVKEALSRLGVTNCVELDWWEKRSIDSKADVVLTPARHWTARTLTDKNTCLWGSFAVIGNQTRLYFAGDTAYCPSLFKTIGDLYGPFDLSLIPIGAYKPRWFMKDVHCNPAEAVQIHLDLKSNQSAAIHWGTFRLADDGDLEPALELGRVRASVGVSADSFFTMAQGETIVLGAKPQHDLSARSPLTAAAYAAAYREDGEDN